MRIAIDPGIAEIIRTPFVPQNWAASSEVRLIFCQSERLILRDRTRSVCHSGSIISQKTGACSVHDRCLKIDRRAAIVCQRQIAGGRIAGIHGFVQFIRRSGNLYGREHEVVRVVLIGDNINRFVTRYIMSRCDLELILLIPRQAQLIRTEIIGCYGVYRRVQYRDQSVSHRLICVDISGISLQSAARRGGQGKVARNSLIFHDINRQSLRRITEIKRSQGIFLIRFQSQNIVSVPIRGCVQRRADNLDRCRQGLSRDVCHMSMHKSGRSINRLNCVIDIQPSAGDSHAIQSVDRIYRVQQLLFDHQRDLCWVVQILIDKTCACRREHQTHCAGYCRRCHRGAGHGCIVVIRDR